MEAGQQADVTAAVNPHEASILRFSYPQMPARPRLKIISKAMVLANGRIKISFLFCQRMAEKSRGDYQF